MTDIRRAVGRAAITLGAIGAGMILGVLFQSYTLAALVGLFGGTLVGRKFW